MATFSSERLGDGIHCCQILILLTNCSSCKVRVEVEGSKKLAKLCSSATPYRHHVIPIASNSIVAIEVLCSTVNDLR